MFPMATAATVTWVGLDRLVKKRLMSAYLIHVGMEEHVLTWSMGLIVTVNWVGKVCNANAVSLIAATHITVNNLLGIARSPNLGTFWSHSTCFILISL